MYLKRLSRTFIISGALIIWAIKFVIRPLHLLPDASFFLGIAPNLLGSFLIPFGAFWLFSGRNYLIARFFRIQSAYDLRLVCVIGFGLLIINEYLQLIPYFGRTFDYNDIIFSSIGLTASYFSFFKLHQRVMQQVA